VANLLLARARAREREIAVRVALGAGRGRVVRQLLTESVLLSGAGAALGLLLARWAVDALPSLSADILRLSTVRVDPWVLAFTGLVSVLTGMLFGLAPAWHAARSSAAAGLREGGRGAAGGAVARRLRSSLAVSEVALALVVLVGAGLLVKSLVRLLSVDTGFVADQLLTVHLPFTGGPRSPEQRAALAGQVVERIAVVPGVTAVGGGTGLPPVTPQRVTDFAVEGQETPAGGRRAFFVAVTPGYFDALGAELREGRAFDERDRAGAPEVVIVSARLARYLFGGEDAVGRRVRLVNPEYGAGWRTIVGVVADVRFSGLADTEAQTIYTPYPQNPHLLAGVYLVVRSRGDDPTLGAGIRRAVASSAPGLHAVRLRSMEEVVRSTVAAPRLNASLLSLFSLLALVLAATGIYGLVSHAIAQRSYEIGVRIAMGARAGDVVRLVLRQVLAVVGVGLAAGALASAAGSRALQSLLFEVEPTDPATFVAVALVLLGVGLLASYVPVRRATRIDPVRALRSE
jgi:predicted permease